MRLKLMALAFLVLALIVPHTQVLAQRGGRGSGGRGGEPGGQRGGGRGGEAGGQRGGGAQRGGGFGGGLSSEGSRGGESRGGESRGGDSRGGSRGGESRGGSSGEGSRGSSGMGPYGGMAVVGKCQSTRHGFQWFEPTGHAEREPRNRCRGAARLDRVQGSTATRPALQ